MTASTDSGVVQPASMPVIAYLRAAVGVLDPRHRRRLGLIVAVFSGLAMLDLAALFVILAVTVAATQAQAGESDPSGLPIPGVVIDAASAVGITTVGQLAAWLAVLAVFLFVGKAGLAAYGLRRTLRFLARREAQLTHTLTGRLMAAPLSFHLPRRYLDVMTDVTVGAESLVMKALAPACLIAAELVLVTVVSVGLVILAPIVAAVAVLYFGAVLLILNRVIGRRAAVAGEADVTSTRQGMILLQWALGGFREVVTRGAEARFTDMVGDVRVRGAEARADTAFLQLVPRYFLEASLVLGMALVFAVQLPFSTPVQAFAGLSLFAIAGFRLLPSLQRIQASMATIKGGQAFGERCLKIRADLAGFSTPRPNGGELHQALPLSEGVRFEGVAFRYEGADRDAVADLSLLFARGSTTALVGASGSGKSTTIDVLLGLLRPTRGTILVDDVPLEETLEAWRHSIGYVPQSVFLMPTTIRDNITLGVADGTVDDTAIWTALEKASMDDVVRALPGQLDYLLGDAGAGLSGGQRQRLGIARALLLEPSVLVLDEATSALDVETEAEIAETLAALSTTLTTVVVAHRLSTVQKADHVLFFKEGRVDAQGTFAEVCAAVPDFARQVALSGLSGAAQ